MMKPKPRFITESESALINRLVDADFSIAEISRAVGRPYSTVREYLMRTDQHVPIKRWWRVPDGTMNRAIDWYHRGVPVARICEHFHINGGSLHYHLRQRGVPLRYPRKSAEGAVTK